MARPNIHRMYVDESGEKEYGEKTSQYFVYAGVVVDAADELELDEAIAKAQQECFGRTTPVGAGASPMSGPWA